MKVIVHISDLHFGTADYFIADKLIEKITDIEPDVVVISGDLTQRARKNQFVEAENYLKRIKYPKVVIPGNHDIPLFDIFRRFFMPLTRYKNYITSNLSPMYMDEEIVIFGVNTARSFTWKNGRISIKQIAEMEKVLCPLSNDKIKFLVTHHPFIPPPGDNGIALVGRSAKALKVIDACSVDFLLAGHLHQGYNGDIRRHYPARKRVVISVQAGTAISRRIRKQNNAFNLIIINSESVEIQINTWNGKEFTAEDSVSYKREKEFWKK